MLPPIFAVPSLKTNAVFGGLLADPVTQYPGHLGSNSPLANSKGVRHLLEYPYAPPNILSAVLLFLEAALVWLGLRETLESRKYLRDRGLEVADTLRYWFRKLKFGLCGYTAIGQEDVTGPDTLEYSPVEDIGMSAVNGTTSVLFTTALFDFQMGYVSLFRFQRVLS